MTGPTIAAVISRELKTIERTGFISYFLIVGDFVRYGRSRGIACVARGSAAGSLVAALAPSFPLLLTGRLVQGAGSGAVPVLALGVVAALGIKGLRIGAAPGPVDGLKQMVKRAGIPDVQIGPVPGFSVGQTASFGLLAAKALQEGKLDGFWANGMGAEVAVRETYVRPAMTQAFGLELKACRHPVVERVLPRGKFIPNDVRFDEAARIILLTGPNMAGKSTVLRQVGLAVIMAHMGSFIPAEAATMGVVDRVFTRVGASDNLGRGQSTFMVEMAETSAIVHGASERSLVLLDEIGRGTSTYDGVAIAWAVTEHLHDRIGCKSIFATHYHELTQLTERLHHVRNFNVAVREVGDQVLFLHELRPGATDRSYGIHVAQLAGLPPEVIARAAEILTLLESGHHVAGLKPPPAPDAGQLALFEEHPVLADLRTLDPDSMTPLEALTRLAELKRRAEQA